MVVSDSAVNWMAGAIRQLQMEFKELKLLLRTDAKNKDFITGKSVDLPLAEPLRQVISLADALLPDLTEVAEELAGTGSCTSPDAAGHCVRAGPCDIGQVDPSAGHEIDPESEDDYPLSSSTTLARRSTSFHKLFIDLKPIAALALKDVPGLARIPKIRDEHRFTEFMATLAGGSDFLIKNLHCDVMNDIETLLDAGDSFDEEHTLALMSDAALTFITDGSKHWQNTCELHLHEECPDDPVVILALTNLCKPKYDIYIRGIAEDILAQHLGLHDCFDDPGD